MFLQKKTKLTKINKNWNFIELKKKKKREPHRTYTTKVGIKVVFKPKKNYLFYSL